MKCRSGGVTIGADDAPALVASLQIKSGACRLFKRGQPSVLFHTQDRESVSQALERVRNAARQRKTERFTALYHHITPELLRMSFYALRRGAAASADGVRWQDYEADLDTNIKALHERVHRGTYRAQPSRRRFIPKADGRLRPLAIAAIEDKIVQRATNCGAQRDLRGRLPWLLVWVPP
ncbi:Bll8206 protein [Neorhizobium galegae bv. orientalis]|nr:Bll8206 protein [Neorhizobium galegae bv. orientalis]